MRTYWGAHKATALHSVVRHATSLVKLGEGTRIPTLPTWEERRSRPRSSRSSWDPTIITPGMAIEEAEHSSSSTSERKTKRGASRSKLQNKVKKTPTTVISITQQQQYPVIHLLENASFCRFCFDKEHRAKECPAIPLQVRFSLLQEREKSKINIP